MMDTPERIWLEYYPDEYFIYFDDIVASDGAVSEYIRRDIYDAAVSKARVDALRKAAGTVYRKLGVTENSIRTADLAHDTILALIKKEPKP